MALYASILSKAIPDALGHILIASIISTPAAIAISVPHGPGGGVGHGGKARVPGRDLEHGRGDPRDRRWGAAPRQHRSDAGGAGGTGEPRQPGSGAATEVAGAPVTLQRLFGIALAPLV